MVGQGVDPYTGKTLPNSRSHTGGKIGYYIALYTRRYYVFELSPDILKQCEELHVNLGFEIFLDDTE